MTPESSARLVTGTSATPEAAPVDPALTLGAPAGVPYVASATPPGLRTVRVDELPAIDQRALHMARQVVDHAHAPQAQNHRAAAVVADRGAGQDPRYVIFTSVNTDSAMRGRSCAELGALAAAPGTWRRIESIVVTSDRKKPNAAPEPPAAPCGACRTHLTSDLAAHLDRPGADENTRVILAGAHAPEVLVVRMGDLTPLNFLKGPFSPENLLALGLPSLSVLSLNAVRKQGIIHGVPGSIIGQLVDQATAHIDRSVVPLSNRPMGAAVWSGGGDIIPAATVEFSAIDGGRSAPYIAVQQCIAESATDIIQAVAVCAADDPNRGGITALDGTTLQYLFHFAQVGGVDFPVIFARRDRDEIVVINVSDLLPLGEGPVDSASTRGNLPLYRRIYGEAAGEPNPPSTR